MKHTQGDDAGPVNGMFPRRIHWCSVAFDILKRVRPFTI